MRCQHLEFLQRTIDKRAGVAWCVIAAVLVLGTASASEDTQEPSAGAQLYQTRCAKCHGLHGEGTADHYPKPLVGTKSVGELTALIERTMPEDAPETCVGEDARLVAQYIYDEFYSPIAQARRAPPRLQLSRLTVNQYRQVVADLVGMDQPAPPWPDQRGLAAEYFDGRGFRQDKRKLNRVDAMIHFDFGDASPLEGEISKEEFSIRWRGGLWVPETGSYEFVVETANAIRLYVNDQRVPLIDAWVRSGDERVHRGSLFLLGGRVYPLRLEFLKSKEPTASVKLLWKMPHRAEALITPDFLAPGNYPPVFVVTTAFPPDDRSMGYERGSSMSMEYQAAALEAALATAHYVADNIDQLAGTTAQAADRREKLQSFCRRFLARAFRRPLSSEEEALFLERAFRRESSDYVAVKRCVLMALQSPRFLYQELPVDEPSQRPYLRAARLSFVLWDSIPDESLWRAAAEGRLQDEAQVRAHAERMLDDLRARAKLRQFLYQWLKLDHMQEIAKSPDLFPDFTPELVSDLRMSLDLFLDEILWGPQSDLRRLFQESYVFASSRMASFYGWQLPTGASTPEQPFVRVPLDPNLHAGIVSHPMLMAGFAYTAASSPIHRGVFIARSVLGKFLRPPPEAVAPLAPDLHPDLTTRARVELQTSPAACQSCHAMINHLGFALENYDAVGRYRLLEKQQPVNATGQYRQPDGQLVTFIGARQLANYLAGSAEVADAFVDQLAHFLVKQPIRALGPRILDELSTDFQQHDWNVRRLMVQIAVRYAMADVTVDGGTGQENSHDIALPQKTP